MKRRASRAVVAQLGGLALAVAGCGGGDSHRGLTPFEMHLYLEPTTLDTALAFKRVAQGYDASCMLTVAGEAWCWGGNEYGQLGAVASETCSEGNVPCSWQPLRAASPMRFASLSPGLRQSCGLDTTGQAWCWGSGYARPVGSGNSVKGTTPVAIADGRRFVQIDAGRDSSIACGLDDGGTIRCWGLVGGDPLGTVNATASPVQAPRPFASIGVGSGHVCGLDTSGQAWCWGNNDAGQLGRGAPGPVSVPTAVVGGHRFASIAVGGNFTCGLTAAGTAWCWGSFGPGVGGGISIYLDVPTAVAGGHLFKNLSAGYSGTCGLTDDGTAWCWGLSMFLGDGTEQSSAAPVAVAGGRKFRELQVGGVATCGITIEGTPMCWGSNFHGSVGQSNVDP